MNWPQLITDLQEQGFTQPQIAARVGCAQATVSELLRGKTSDPRYSLGVSLKALHKLAVPVKKTQRRTADAA